MIRANRISQQFLLFEVGCRCSICWSHDHRSFFLSSTLCVLYECAPLRHHLGAHYGELIFFAAARDLSDCSARWLSLLPGCTVAGHAKRRIMQANIRELRISSLIWMQFSLWKQCFWKSKVIFVHLNVYYYSVWDAPRGESSKLYSNCTLLQKRGGLAGP